MAVLQNTIFFLALMFVSMSALSVATASSPCQVEGAVRASDGRCYGFRPEESAQDPVLWLSDGAEVKIGQEKSVWRRDSWWSLRGEKVTTLPDTVRARAGRVEVLPGEEKSERSFVPMPSAALLGMALMALSMVSFYWRLGRGAIVLAIAALAIAAIAALAASLAAALAFAIPASLAVVLAIAALAAADSADSRVYCLYAWIHILLMGVIFINA